MQTAAKAYLLLFFSVIPVVTFANSDQCESFLTNNREDVHIPIGKHIELVLTESPTYSITIKNNLNSTFSTSIFNNTEKVRPEISQTAAAFRAQPNRKTQEQFINTLKKFASESGVRTHFDETYLYLSADNQTHWFNRLLRDLDISFAFDLVSFRNASNLGSGSGFYEWNNKLTTNVLPPFAFQENNTPIHHIYVHEIFHHMQEKGRHTDNTNSYWPKIFIKTNLKNDFSWFHPWVMGADNRADLQGLYGHGHHIEEVEAYALTAEYETTLTELYLSQSNLDVTSDIGGIGFKHLAYAIEANNLGIALIKNDLNSFTKWSNTLDDNTIIRTHSLLEKTNKRLMKTDKILHQYFDQVMQKLPSGRATQIKLPNKSGLDIAVSIQDVLRED